MEALVWRQLHDHEREDGLLRSRSVGGKGTRDGWLPWADVRAVYELLDAHFCRHRWRSKSCISDEAASPTSLKTQITVNALLYSSIHPSVICTAYPSGSYGSCSQSQLALGERRGSPWAGPHGTVTLKKKKTAKY